MRLATSTLFLLRGLSTIILAKSTATHGALKARDAYKGQWANINITQYTTRDCSGKGMMNYLKYRERYFGSGELKAVKINRTLDSTEQLDFSGPEPPGATRTVFHTGVAGAPDAGFPEPSCAVYQYTAPSDWAANQ